MSTPTRFGRLLVWLTVVVLSSCTPSTTVKPQMRNVPVTPTITGESKTHSPAVTATQAETASEEPRLVIETNGHQALVGELLFTADGRELISVSDDKTIRIWTVSLDGRSASLGRTIRGQIGEGREGMIYAAALSPADGSGRHRWLAVGGFLAGSPAYRHAIRLHDYTSGEIVAVLQGHTDLVLALAFSPQGRWLASAGKDAAILLWDLDSLTGGQLTKAPLVLTAHTDHIYDLAWSPTGNRLASAAYDHTVGLWNTEQLAQEQVKLITRLRGHSNQVRTVAFHPDGTVLASGGKDQTIRLWRASDGKALGKLATSPNHIAALAFSPDGQSILAGCAGGDILCQRVTLYTYPAGREQRVFTEHNNIVIATAFHPSGEWVASGGGDNKEILLWHTQTGDILSRLEGGGRTIWAVGFSPDGRFLSWGYTPYKTINESTPLVQRFDLMKLVRLAGGLSSASAIRAQEQVGDRTLSIERGGPSRSPYRLKVARRGSLLSTIERDHTNGYQHSAYTFTPDGQSILSGGHNGTLTLYTLEGRTRAKFIGHAGDIKAVAISADGRWALSGSSDQTLRLWSLVDLPSSGSPAEILPALSLFPAIDGEWVAWTPEGFFTASANGTKLIGYIINQGFDQLAQYVAVDQLYDRFYRPDLIHTKLYGDPEELWQKEGALIDAPTVLAAGLPPEIEFITPVADTTVKQRRMEVQVALIDQGGGIGKVVWKINGVTIAVDTTPDGSGARSLTVKRSPSLVLSKRITLDPGPNTLTVTAYNQDNEVASVPAERTLTVPAASPPPTTPLVVAQQTEPAPKSSEATSPPPPASSEVGQQTQSTQAPKTADSSPPPLSPPVAQPGEPTKEPQVAIASPLPLSPADTPEKPVPEPQKSASSPPSPPPSSVTDQQAQPVPEETTPAIAAPPTLRVLAVGINRYRDRALLLNYAVPDAKALVTKLRQASVPIFQNVIVHEVIDEQATFSGIDAAFQTIAAQTAPPDVFVLYLAGHGKTLDGRYYFLPQDFRYRSEDSIRLEAINQDHLQRWLASIPARKSLVLIDTCESGSFTQSLALLRGMAEKTAIEKLTRATGRATIVAATDLQPALEGYKGHGVFTYVLLQALSQADVHFGNKDSITSIYELAHYVDDQVPAITMSAFRFEQFPQVYMLGSDFPIGIAQAN